MFVVYVFVTERLASTGYDTGHSTAANERTGGQTPTKQLSKISLQYRSS